MKSYAVITGASQGLGKCFARELAGRGYNLILISLPDQKLPELKVQIEQEYGVDVVIFERDIAHHDTVLEITQAINNAYPVSFLINNAGIGGSRKFTDVNAEYIHRIIQVNVMATSLFTHQLLPNLLAQPEGYILNVSSLAAFSPIGYKTVYPASKSFVHSFSRGLFQELKGTNVLVSVVNPGPMATNEDSTARIKKQGLIARLAMSNPEQVARKCINQIFKKDAVIMVNPFSWLTLTLLPIWIRLPIMTKAIRKEAELA